MIAAAVIACAVAGFFGWFGKLADDLYPWDDEQPTGGDDDDRG